MASVNHSVLFLASASAASKTLTTGRAIWTFDSDLAFDAGRRYRVAISQFGFVNFFINISSTLANNKFYYSDDIGNLVKYSVTIPDGSYNVSDLSEAINVGVVANGHTNNLIVLIPDFSTNRIQFTINAIGWILNFPVDTPYLLLGCTLNQTIPNGALTAVALYNELGPNTATFNTITSLFVHTSLSNRTNFSGRQSNVLFSLVPTAPIGSSQSNEPSNLIWADTDLSGASIHEVQVYITDQAGAAVNLSEDFNTTILIEEY